MPMASAEHRARPGAGRAHRAEHERHREQHRERDRDDARDPRPERKLVLAGIEGIGVQVADQLP